VTLEGIECGKRNLVRKCKGIRTADDTGRRCGDLGIENEMTMEFNVSISK
jgi:hypothetical protein